MQHFYILSMVAMNRLRSVVPVHECIGRGLAEKWLLANNDRLDDFIVGSWYETNGRVTMGGTATARDFLYYKV